MLNANQNNKIEASVPMHLDTGEYLCSYKSTVSQICTRANRRKVILMKLKIEEYINNKELNEDEK